MYRHRQTDGNLETIFIDHVLWSHEYTVIYLIVFKEIYISPVEAGQCKKVGGIQCWTDRQTSGQTDYGVMILMWKLAYTCNTKQKECP